MMLLKYLLNRGGIEDWETYLARMDRLEDLRVKAAVAVGFGVAILLNLYFSRRKKQRRLDKETALKNGTVITARLVKEYAEYDRNDTHLIKYYSGRYEYEVDGVKKHKTVNRTNPTLTLYYTDDPHKAFHDIDDHGLGVQFSLLMGLVCGVATMFITGYLMGIFFYR